MQSPVNRGYRPTLPVFSSIVAVVLMVQALAPSQSAAQPALACGQVVSGTIMAPGQQDQFTFLGAAGDVVSLTLVQTSALDPAFTAVVTLVGPGTNTTRSSGVWFQTLPATGAYTVRVRDVYSTGRGSYALRLGWALPLSKQCGDRTGLACGQQVEASIDAPLELDLFSFAGQQGSVILLTLLGLVDIDPGFQVHGRLLGPTGVPLANVPIHTTTPVTLPAAGTYALAIYDLGNFRRRGTYSLRLESQGPCPPPPVPPSLGLKLNGTAFPGGTTMMLTGILAAGNIPGPVDAYIVLRLPSGQLLSLQLGGRFVPGIVPIARRFVPFDFQGALAQYTFTGGEPAGTYTWYAVLTTPGTLNFVSPLQQLAFTVP
jgi:hypothetical protein